MDGWIYLLFVGKLFSEWKVSEVLLSTLYQIFVLSVHDHKSPKILLKERSMRKIS